MLDVFLGDTGLFRESNFEGSKQPETTTYCQDLSCVAEILLSLNRLAESEYAGVLTENIDTEKYQIARPPRSRKRNNNYRLAKPHF
jgi:hypothetical protein